MLQSVAPPTQVCPINKSRNTAIHFHQLFFSLQFIQKCQRIICSHFLLSIISPTIPFAHPQHCCHLPAFLPDWSKHLCDFKSLSLSFRTRKFFPQKCFTDCDAVQFIFYKNWELVKSRASNNRSTVSSAKTKIYLKGQHRRFESSFGQFVFIYVHIDSLRLWFPFAKYMPIENLHKTFMA